MTTDPTTTNETTTEATNPANDDPTSIMYRYGLLVDGCGNVNPAYRVLSKMVPKGWKMTPEKWERVRRALLD